MDTALVTALVLPGLLYVLPLGVMVVKKWWTPRRNIIVLCGAMLVIVSMYAVLMVADGVDLGTVIALAIGWLLPIAALVATNLLSIRQYERENTLPDDKKLRWNLRRGKRI